METCSDNHETVAFVGSHWNQCPVCPIIEERDELQNNLDTANEKIKELESEIEALDV